jgi:hypothetical protein
VHGIAKNHAFVDGNKRTGEIDREAIAVLLADAMGDPVPLDST